jgi:hypothetical protein
VYRSPQAAANAWISPCELAEGLVAAEVIIERVCEAERKAIDYSRKGTPSDDYYYKRALGSVTYWRTRETVTKRKHRSWWCLSEHRNRERPPLRHDVMHDYPRPAMNPVIVAAASLGIDPTEFLNKLSGKEKAAVNAFDEAHLKIIASGRALTGGS